MIHPALKAASKLLKQMSSLYVNTPLQNNSSNVAHNNLQLTAFEKKLYRRLLLICSSSMV